jgi:hypothetical protein
MQVAQNIMEISIRLHREPHPERTYGAAKAAFLYATPATLFWAYGAGLHREVPIAVRRALSAPTAECTKD